MEPYNTWAKEKERIVRFIVCHLKWVEVRDVCVADADKFSNVCGLVEKKYTYRNMIYCDICKTHVTAIAGNREIDLENHARWHLLHTPQIL